MHYTCAFWKATLGSLLAYWHSQTSSELYQRTRFLESKIQLHECHSSLQPQGSCRLKTTSSMYVSYIVKYESLWINVIWMPIYANWVWVFVKPAKSLGEVMWSYFHIWSGCYAQCRLLVPNSDRSWQTLQWISGYIKLFWCWTQIPPNPLFGDSWRCWKPETQSAGQFWWHRWLPAYDVSFDNSLIMYIHIVSNDAKISCVYNEFIIRYYTVDIDKNSYTYLLPNPTLQGSREIFFVAAIPQGSSHFV